MVTSSGSVLWSGMGHEGGVQGGDLVYGMMRCEKIVISAINGVAVGAGLAVALMADISLMAEEARITDGHAPWRRRWRSCQYHLAAALRACQKVLPDHG